MDTIAFIHQVFIGIIALFPVINPIGTAFVVNPFFTGLDRSERKKIALKVALYTFYLCVVTLFSGHWILQLFGLSVSVVQLAGGIMICKIGWDFLSGNSVDADKMQIESGKNISDKLFYPITFPMTAGAGTISVLFTLSAHNQHENFMGYMVNVSAILIAIIVMCILVFVMYFNSNTLIQRLGAKNEIVINRIVAFLIFCVGLQIASGGAINLLKLV